MGHNSPPPFRLDPERFIVDECFMGYHNTPENRVAIRKLYEDAKPILKQPIEVSLNYGTPGPQ